MAFRERQQVLICVAAVVMVGGFLLFRYLPSRKKLRSLEQQRVEQTLAITKASNDSLLVPTIEEQLAKLQEIAENYEKNVPAKRSLGVFLHRITDLMNSHELKDQLVQPGEEVTSGRLNGIPISMQCKGDLKQMFKLFKSLAESERLVRIEQVKLSNAKDFSGDITMQTKGVIYYRSEP
jgi:Tfp pilus assembly protein PilO